MSTRKEWSIALFGHDGTEYGRAPIGPLVPDGGDLVNADAIKFQPMPHVRGVVTSFALFDAEGRVVSDGRLIRYMSFPDCGAWAEFEPHAVRIDAGIFPDSEEQDGPPVSPPPIQKLERDGKVGVVISNGYGVGWSTSYFDEGRGHLRETVCMRADIVQAVLDGDLEGAERLAAEACGGEFDGDSADLTVVWVPKGSIFEFDGFDGIESIHIIGSREYMTA